MGGCRNGGEFFSKGAATGLLDGNRVWESVVPVGLRGGSAASCFWMAEASMMSVFGLEEVEVVVVCLASGTSRRGNAPLRGRLHAHVKNNPATLY